MYQLSILLPSKYENKRERFLQNLRETVSDFNSIEIVICLDGDEETKREDNIVTVYYPPTKARGHFFNACWRESSGRFLLMANDDILFKTKNWDKLIPYEKYPDEVVVFGFKDNQFNQHFFCHPIWSRKVMQINPNLFEAPYQITKCDNTIWDIHPPHRRIYLPEIEIDHIQDKYGPEWLPIYEEDNKLYMDEIGKRLAVRDKIMSDLNLFNNKVMIGVITGEYARRADFYDHFNRIEKPSNSICISVHGQSIAHNRNQVVEQALVHKCTHIFFLDDDVICEPGIIFNLLENDKDIVCGLQLKRNYPHLPLIFKERVDDIKAKHYQLSDFNGERLVPIYSAGLGCALIKTRVFDRMEKPWFRMGELTKDQIGEDSSFYRKMDDLGISSFCDLSCPVGHIASFVVRPINKENTWAVDYDTNGGGSVSFIPAVINDGPLNNLKGVT